MCCWTEPHCTLTVKAVSFSGWWVMAGHAWRQYGFSEMTGPRGVTLKRMLDISRLVFYRTGFLFLSVLFTLTDASSLFVSASSSFLILRLFSLSSQPPLALVHCPLTACWLNKWPFLIFCDQLSLMKTFAADRTCGTARASDQSVRDGCRFSSTSI